MHVEEHSRDVVSMLRHSHQLERTIVTEWVKKGSGGKEELGKKGTTLQLKTQQGLGFQDFSLKY